MKAPLRAVLAERIDYAGLFPPAGLPMEQAVANYASYRASGDAWALGRFVVPAARLAEFERAASPHFGGEVWRLSLLAQADGETAVRDFNARHAGAAVIDTIEARAATIDDVAALAPLRDIATVFVEVPVADDPDALIHAIAAHGLCAKIRTGGVTADAFPSPVQVARFLVTCGRHGVRYKATAGLHHPMRAEYALTNAADAPRGTMFGYLNVLLAATLARRGASVERCAALLAEQARGAFAVDDAGIRWQDERFTLDDLTSERRQGAASFGSCSFREPLDDLNAVGFA